jgi:hypothetical protein
MENKYIIQWDGFSEKIEQSKKDALKLLAQLLSKSEVKAIRIYKGKKL